MRYFLELAYKGTHFVGYQRQPNGRTVQAAIEEALATLLRQPTEVVGCGRTDTGVHAEHYFLHFDTPEPQTDLLLHRLNAIIGSDIAFYRLIPVHDEAHARFDARSRSYRYHVQPRKNPFHTEFAYHCPFWGQVDTERLQAAARLLLDFQDFAPFCKTRTDAKTRRCLLTRSEWCYDAAAQQWHYHVRADRFLRGMVRLIVGMCIQVGRGLLTIEEVRQALEQQTPLRQALSVPPEGLFLTDICYDFI